MNLVDRKAELRRIYRQNRHETFNPHDSWIHVARAYEFSEIEYIASYFSYGEEPKTSDINDELIRMGKKILLPRLREDNDLEWVIWNGNLSSLVSRGNVMEPVGEPASEKLIQAVIVPALHVDHEGNRLGQGGGSYDRALSRIQAWKVALVHEGEVTSETLPHASHDQKVNAVATPDLLIRF